MNWWFLVSLVGSALLIPTAYAGLIGAPWAPTRMASVRKAFDNVGVGEKDVVVDLGAGDGSIMKEAVKRGARAVGYELSPIMWLVAYIRTVQYKKSKLHYGNFFTKKLPKDTTRIFLFLMPKHMPRVGKYIALQGVNDKVAVLSYAFPFQQAVSEAVIREKNCAPLYVYSVAELRRAFDNSGR